MPGFKNLSVGGIVGGVVLLLILFAVLTEVIPQIDQSANDFSNTTDSEGNPLPFANFFASGGILILVIMAGVLIAVLGYFGVMKSR
jgi:amino acid transporter